MARAAVSGIREGQKGVHWPDIDEDISAAGMLYGTPAPRPQRTEVKPEPALA